MPEDFDDYLDIQIERDEFHRKMGGALPKGSLMLIEGKYGYGKSIICQRLLYSVLTHGTSVTYISNELSTKDFLKQMDSVKYCVDEYLLNDQLLFIPMFPLLGRVVFRQDLIKRLMCARALFDREFIAIDTLSFLLVKDNSTADDCFRVVQFFKMMANLDKSLIITVDPEHLNNELLTLIRSMADIHFELRTAQLGGDTKRYMYVNRFKRAMSTVPSSIPFRVEPDEGIGIEISAMV